MEGKLDNVIFGNFNKVLEEIGINICLFGKGSVDGYCCMGVILVCDENIEKVREKVLWVYYKLDI